MDDPKLERAEKLLWRLVWKNVPDEPPITIMWKWAPDSCPLCGADLVLTDAYQWCCGVETRVLYASCPRRHPFIIWPVAE